MRNIYGVLICILLCLLTEIQAQTGPAGVGNASGVGGQPENIMWFKPDGMVNVAGAIATWTDASGNNRDLVISAPTERPTINTFSGFNYLNFDGTNDRIPFDGSLLTNTPYTIFMVVGRRANGLGGSVLFGGSTGSANQNLHPYFNSNTQINYHHWGNDYNTTISPALTAGAEQFGIFTFRLNATNRSMFQNGNHLANGANGSQLSSFTGAHIGHRPNGSNYAQIDLAEVIFYANTLNDAQVLLVSNYLSTKYGLPMAGLDIFTGHDAAFVNDFAGIGALSGNGGGQDGSHDLATSAGLYLSTAAALSSGEFVAIAHPGGSSSASTSDLTAGVTHRWERSWYLDRTASISQNITLGFSMGEGITGGQFPGALSNYRLLYRAANSGNFSVVSTVTTTLQGSDRIAFEVTDANLPDGYYTIGTVDNAASPIAGLPTTTWYSYATGTWDDYTTWTLDPSGTNFSNPTNSTPEANPTHRVVILNGDEITITTNNLQNSYLEIQAGGILNLAATSGHSFGEIRGEGRIRSSGNDNFPSFSNATSFQSQGTFEVTGANPQLTTASTTGSFNNLVINLSANSDTFTLVRNLSLNGNLTIQRGIFKINSHSSSTRLDVEILGNVTVELNGGIRVGRGNTLNNNIGGTFPYRMIVNGSNAWVGADRPANLDYFNMYHRMAIWGNFTNNGSVRFTNQDRPNYGAFAGQDTLCGGSTLGSVAPGAVTVAFRGSTNTTLTCNGVTDFYQLILNKGANETYKLTLNAAQPQFFNLYGPNRLGGVNSGTANLGPMGTYACDGNGRVMLLKALSLLNGTFEVTGQTILLCLTNSGGNVNTNSDYYIPSTAKLWINSPNAEVYTTIDATTGTPPTVANFTSIANHLPSAYAGQPQNRLPNTTVDGVNFAVQSSASAMSVYGTIQISQGIFSTRNSAGFIYWSSSAAKVIIEGGFADASVFRNANAGGIASFIMSGGKLTLRTNDPSNGLPGELGNTPTFTVGDDQNSFTMTGGTLEIQDATGQGGIFINCAPNNINVSGGSVLLKTRDNDAFRINTKAPLYNLILVNQVNSTNANARFFVDSLSSGGNDFPIQPLTVLNDLVLETGTTRTSSGSTFGTFLDLKGQTLTIGGDLTLNDNTVLDVWSGEPNNANSARLVFNGNTNSILYIGDITTYDNVLTGFIDPESEEAYRRYELPLFDLIVNKTGAKLSLSAKSPAVGPNPNVSNLSTFKTASGGKNINNWANNLVKVTNVLSIAANSTLSQIDPFDSIATYSLRLYGSNITNLGTLFEYQDGVTNKNGIVKMRKGGGDITISTSPSSVFGNVRLNSGGDIVNVTSDVYMKRIEFRHGRLNIGTHNLKVDVLDLNIEAGDVPTRDGGDPRMFSTDDMIIMAGNAGDGGLSLKVQRSIDNSYPSFSGANSRYNDARWLWFPIGTNANASSRYTPAVCYLITNGTLTGDEYITVRVVDGNLQTTNQSGGDLLSYYWRVTHQGFAASEEPTVSWIFQYADSDVVGSEASYVPGKVLDVTPFTRLDDGDSLSVKQGGGTLTAGSTSNAGDIVGTNPANIIVFNGIGTYAAPVANDNIESIAVRIFRDGPNGVNTAWQNAVPATGFTLENANYTAGASARFTGAPQIFYSRRTAADMDWHNGNNWSLTGHTGAAAGDFPQSGDIAILFGNNSSGSGGRHWYNVTSADIDVAEIIFEDVSILANQPWRPRISANPNRNINASKITGFGELYLRMTNADIPQINGDIQEFAQNSVSVINYRHQGTNNTSITIPSNLTEYPRLDFESSGGTRTIRIGHELTVNFSMGIGQDAIVEADNNITVVQDLRNRDNTSGTFRFGQSGNWTVDIGRNLRLGNAGGNAFDVEVLNTTPSSRIHTLKIGGDITHNTGILDLYNGTGTANNCVLELNSTTTAEYNRLAPASIPQLYRLVMNKGTDTTAIFTFNNHFTLAGRTDTTEKALEILNGKLVFDDPAFNLTLSSGGGDFYLPNVVNPASASGAGALVLEQGRFAVTGSSTGIILDGMLRVNNALLHLADSAGNGNNFIEYSSSGNAAIELLGASGRIWVGSHLRMSTANNNGVLKYKQTNGQLQAGMLAAPLTNRGVFEISGNIGTSFSHSGGTIRINRANGAAPSIAALYLRPQSMSTSGTSTITIGSPLVPSQNIRVDVLDNNGSRDFQNLVIDVPSTGTVTLSEPIAVAGNLTINANATLAANGKQIRLTGNDFTNNGSYIAGANTFVFQNNNHQYYGVVTTFHNLTISPSAAVTLNNGVNVTNDLTITQGTFALQSHTVNLQRHLVNNGLYTTGTGRLILNGNVPQQISGSGTFGRLELNNPTEGATALSNLFFEGNLELREGVLKTGDFLLHLGATANFVSLGANPFSTTKMVRTNVVTSDRGVRKTFNSAASGFVFPVGVIRGASEIYTPLTVNLNTLSGPKSITLIPVNGRHPSVDSPFRTLDFFWRVFDSSPTTLSTGTLVFGYSQSLVDNAANEPSYIPARLQNVQWSKFPSTDVDETNNTVTFTFDNTSLGTDNSPANTAGAQYTAGLDADIPDQVPIFEYQTSTSGTWNNTANWRRSNDGGVTWTGFGVNIPTNGPSGQIVRIPAGSVVTLEGSDTPANMLSLRNPYSIEINGELVVGNTRGNSLGIVTGSGKITVGGADRAVFPAGDYASFLSNPNSSVEYGGSLSYTLDSRTSTIGALTVSGGGTKSLPSGTQTVNNDLTIASSTVLDNTLNNVNINVGGNMQLNGTLNAGGNNTIDVNGNLNFNAGSTFNQSTNTTLEVAGNITKNASATVNSAITNLILNGSANQTITGVLTFRSITVNNAAGINISGSDPLQVENELNLTNGLINSTGSTSTSNFRIKDGDVNITGASATSYINGPLQLMSLGTGTPYEFPVGNAGRYGAASINPTCANQTWNVTYQNANPHSALGFTIDPAITASNPRANVSQNEYWIIDGPSPCNATVTLRWDVNSLTAENAADRTNLRMMRWSAADSHWKRISNSPSINDGSAQISDIVSFSLQYLTLGSSDSSVNPLPVELLFFKALPSEGAVNLLWATATELNAYAFELYHSVNGKDYDQIAEVNAQGTKYTRTDYAFEHKNHGNGIQYYKLVQTDFDGTRTTYPAVAVELSTQRNLTPEVSVYPNPISGTQPFFIDVFNLDEQENVQISLFNTLGQMVYSKAIAPNPYGTIQHQIPLEVREKAGLHILQVSTAGHKVIKKILFTP